MTPAPARRAHPSRQPRRLGGAALLVASSLCGAAEAAGRTGTTEAEGDGVDPFAPVLVTSSLPEGHIDWTRDRLVVSAASSTDRGAWRSRGVQEQEAVDRLPALIAKAAPRVQVTPDTTAADLIEGGSEAGTSLAASIEGWTIAETRYRTSGGVEVDGELDISRWLQPAMAAMAMGTHTVPTKDMPTGVIVDVRGLPFKPCYAPRIDTPSGEALFDAQRLSPQTAKLRAPVVYASDPAQPAVLAQAGDRPLLAHAASVHGCRATLATADAARLAADPAIAALASQGDLVIVLDLESPP